MIDSMAASMICERPSRSRWLPRRPAGASAGLSHAPRPLGSSSRDRGVEDHPRRDELIDLRRRSTRVPAGSRECARRRGTVRAARRRGPREVHQQPGILEAADAAGPRLPDELSRRASGSSKRSRQKLSSTTSTGTPASSSTANHSAAGRPAGAASAAGRLCCATGIGIHVEGRAPARRWSGYSAATKTQRRRHTRTGDKGREAVLLAVGVAPVPGVPSAWIHA